MYVVLRILGEYYTRWLPVAVCDDIQKAKAIAIDATIEEISYNGTNVIVNASPDKLTYKVSYDVCNHTYTDEFTIKEFDDGEIIVDSPSGGDSTHAIVKVRCNEVYDAIRPRHF